MRMFGSFLNSTRPFYAPDNEGGGGDASLENDVVDGGDSGDSDAGDTPEGGVEAEGQEPQKPLSVRDEIKKAMSEASEGAQKPQQAKKPAAKKPASTAAAPPATPVAPQSTVPAPDRLSKEAKAEWDKAPESIKQAFVKAEQDMQRGVDELKQRYAGIDQALAPHTDALRQMNATPAEAVNRMFLWFKALAGQPEQAFPALAKSMGQDWSKLIAAATGQPPAQGQQQGQNPQGVPEVPEPVKNYIGNLENQVRSLMQKVNEVTTGFGSIQTDIQAQHEQKARENLNIWSQGKKYFEDVRQDMAALLQSGMVPLKNGQVDLDTAYERAIYFNPEVRAKVLAEQQQANQEVQQQTTEAATTARQGQVAKARKAAVSLPVGNAPGNPVAPSKKPQGRQSVRESLKQAIADLRDQ